MVLRSYVGAPVKRKEDPRLITGSSIYVDDLQLPGMVHVAIVRSPYAHAKITGIDTAAARAMPGVVAVVTASDLADVLARQVPGRGLRGTGRDGRRSRSPRSRRTPDPRPRCRAAGAEQGPLRRRAGRRGRRRDARRRPQDAAAAVEVDYEPLPAVVDPYEARQPGAPLLYDNVKNNVSVREETVHGDVDGALAERGDQGQGQDPRPALPSRCRWRRAASSPRPTRSRAG